MIEVPLHSLALGTHAKHVLALAWHVTHVQGYLTHKKTPPPRTQQWVYAYGPVEVLGGGVISYERGSPVLALTWHANTYRGPHS